MSVNRHCPEHGYLPELPDEIQEERKNCDVQFWRLEKPDESSAKMWPHGALRRRFMENADRGCQLSRSADFPSSVDGIGTGVIVERLQKHAIQPDVPLRAELVDPDRHTLVPPLGLGAVGAEQTVPPRQHEAEVTVGFGCIDRVMHPVHVG